MGLMLNEDEDRVTFHGAMKPAGMPGRRKPIGLLTWIRWRWLRWRWLDARREIAYWTAAGIPGNRMRNLREYEEQLACELAAMEARL